MTHEELYGADEGILRIIVMQSEARLNGQCEFASAQDARVGSISNAAIALAAASVAVVGTTAAGESTSPLLVAGIIAAIGFSISAGLAIWCLRSSDFHSCGYYPIDFAHDLREGKNEKAILADFALDLQHRLSENRQLLLQRGSFSNASTLVLLTTPMIALVGALLAA